VHGVNKTFPWAIYCPRSLTKSEKKIPKSGKEKPLDIITCQALEEDKGVNGI
jgi:hypothetical protein